MLLIFVLLNTHGFTYTLQQSKMLVSELLIFTVIMIIMVVISMILMILMIFTTLIIIYRPELMKEVFEGS